RPADCGYPCQKPEASSARETTLQREIAVKNVPLGIFDPSLGIFDPARCRRNPDFWGGFPPKPRSVLRNRQGIPRLSGVSSRAHEAGMRELCVASRCPSSSSSVWNTGVLDQPPRSTCAARLGLTRQLADHCTEAGRSVDRGKVPA